ncbi:MAG: PAS domain S-box protein [Paucibacter sp.]|nr:PAS domain S-box protein [Roseateles sp.]
MKRDFSDDLSSLVSPEVTLGERQALLESTVRARAVQVFFAASSVIFLISAVVLWLLRRPEESVAGTLAPVLATVIGLLGPLFLWKLPRRFGPQGALLCVLLVMVLALVVAWSHGMGLQSINLGMLSLMVALGTSMLGLRAGVALALMSLAALTGLWMAELNGLVPLLGKPAGAARLAAHVGLVAMGLLIGASVLRMVQRATQAAAERNVRFRELLAMAADFYWEMDRDYRFTHVTEDLPGRSGLDLVERVGKTPWELEAPGLSDEEMDAHRADLESHRAFHGLVTRRLGKDGQPRHVSISGEPRFDAAGNFRGYWGVGRDVTAEVRAEQTKQITETRYRELFRRSPSPLLLHRWGRVIDANPAAMAMFGYTQRSSMIGQDLFSHYEPGDAERARQRSSRIEAMPVGGMLPVDEFRLLTLAKRRRLVAETCVRVNNADGPATLSFYTDQTETSKAQEALRRSESLLSHLVAVSPDIVTLNELETGRYIMVNKTYEEVTGYSREEVIGRTPAELGIYRNPAELADVSRTLRDEGRVVDRACEFVGKNGKTISAVMSAAIFEADGKHYTVTNTRDVTESERTRLVQEAILANASIGIALTRDQHFVLANRLVDEMLGLDAGSLAGKHLSAIWPGVDDYKAVAERVRPRLHAGERVELEIEMQRQDGTPFLCRLLGRSVYPGKLEDGTIWIMEDVTERRRTEAALAQAKDDAQAASRAKSAFLANTSHELRTPLNGMLGLARMLQQRGLSEDTRAEYVDQLLESAEGLTSLISDILDLSKVEAGRLSLESLPFSLADMLTTIRLAYATLAHARGLEFCVEVDPAVPGRVVGDPTRVRQILSNYLGNALKFTESGRVVLRVTCPAPGRVRLEVSDTGPGIAAELQPQLFTPFTQADSSTTRRYGGTGLGLSICRELASLMKGEVGVRSVLGEGASFWAELPLPTAAPLRPVSALEPGPSAPAKELRGLRVLMVEDHPVNMMIAVAQLEQWGVVVGQAHDGRQAIEAVMRAADTGRPFDAVLMDVQMPVMGGHQTARELRKRFGPRELPIVALTAAALVSEREEALAAGMNDFLTKPVDAPKLRQTLVRLIGRTVPEGESSHG